MAKRELRYEIFEGGKFFSGIYYWRFRAGNGRIQAVGAEPFPSIGHARRAIRRFERNVSYDADRRVIEVRVLR